jgi:hypothetical protein
MRRGGKTADVSAAAAALLALPACGEASAQAIDASFKFEGGGVIVEGTSLNVAFLTLDGAITKNNIGLVLLVTTLDLTNPLPVGVGDKFTLGWDTLAATFADPMTETSVTGSVDSLLTVVATGTISGGGFSPSPSSLTFTFDDGGLSGSFTALPSSTSVSTAAPEMSTWSISLRVSPPWAPWVSCALASLHAPADSRAGSQRPLTATSPACVPEDRPAGHRRPRAAARVPPRAKPAGRRASKAAAE